MDNRLSDVSSVMVKKICKFKYMTNPFINVSFPQPQTIQTNYSTTQTAEASEMTLLQMCQTTQTTCKDNTTASLRDYQRNLLIGFMSGATRTY